MLGEPLNAILTLFVVGFGAANGSSGFEASFTGDSLSANSWINEGTLGSAVDMNSLTGTVKVESTNVEGGSINSLCFDSSQTDQSSITYIAYDTDSAVRPDLTMEVWFRPDERSGNHDWILGHDNGGYDRAIIAYDTRFGGLAMGTGTTYGSSLGYPALGEWIHIVLTYEDGVATMYQNGGDLAGGSQEGRSVSSDSGSNNEFVGLNGLYSYSSHTVIGCFAQVQMTNRALSAQEVVDLYSAFDSAINQESTTMEPTKVPTTGSPTTASPTTGSPTVEPTAQPSAEPTEEPTRDCSVFHIDEFLMDCSVEFDAHDTHIDTLKSDVASMKDELSGHDLDVADLKESVSQLVNATATMAASIDSINAEMQIVIEYLDRMGDYP